MYKEDIFIRYGLNFYFGMHMLVRRCLVVLLYVWVDSLVSDREMVVRSDM